MKSPLASKKDSPKILWEFSAFIILVASVVSATASYSDAASTSTWADSPLSEPQVQTYVEAMKHGIHRFFEGCASHTNVQCWAPTPCTDCEYSWPSAEDFTTKLSNLIDTTPVHFFHINSSSAHAVWTPPATAGIGTSWGGQKMDIFNGRLEGQLPEIEALLFHHSSDASNSDRESTVSISGTATSHMRATNGPGPVNQSIPWNTNTSPFAAIAASNADEGTKEQLVQKPIIADKILQRQHELWGLYITHSIEVFLNAVQMKSPPKKFRRVFLPLLEKVIPNWLRRLLIVGWSPPSSASPAVTGVQDLPESSSTFSSGSTSFWQFKAGAVPRDREEVRFSNRAMLRLSKVDNLSYLVEFSQLHLPQVGLRFNLTHGDNRSTRNDDPATSALSWSPSSSSITSIADIYGPEISGRMLISLASSPEISPVIRVDTEASSQVSFKAWINNPQAASEAILTHDQDRSNEEMENSSAHHNLKLTSFTDMLVKVQQILLRSDFVRNQFEEMITSLEGQTWSVLGQNVSLTLLRDRTDWAGLFEENPEAANMARVDVCDSYTRKNDQVEGLLYYVQWKPARPLKVTLLVQTHKRNGDVSSKMEVEVSMSRLHLAGTFEYDRIKLRRFPKSRVLDSPDTDFAVKVKQIRTSAWTLMIKTLVKAGKLFTKLMSMIPGTIKKVPRELKQPLQESLIKCREMFMIHPEHSL